MTHREEHEVEMDYGDNIILMNNSRSLSGFCAGG
jgi:hypothetical protein